MKKVLVLGAGMVSRPLVDYLLGKGFSLVLGDLYRDQAEAVIAARQNGRAVAVDSADDRAIEPLIREADLTVSLLPPAFHPRIAACCLRLGKHFLSASYVSPEMRDLNEAAKQRDLIFLNEIGLDPGLDHLTAMEVIDRLHREGYRILGFESDCGGIPAKDAANNALRYKMSWSPAGVLGALTRPARFRKMGHVVEVPGEEMLQHAEIRIIEGHGVYESTPNADSLSYGRLYGIENAANLRRGTLRYPGWASFWRFLLSLGFLRREPRMEFRNIGVLDGLFCLAGEERPQDFTEFVLERAPEQASLILEKVHSLGILDPNCRLNGSYSAFDIMLERAADTLRYQPGEADLVVLHHQWLVEKDKVRELWTSTLAREGTPGGTTAMAFLVGVPAAIAARLVLEGRILDRGVLIPTSPELYVPILEELKTLGLSHEIRKESASSPAAG